MAASGSPVEVLREDRLEDALLRVRPEEESHRGVQLPLVDSTEDLHRGAALEAGHNPGAFDQPRTQHRVPQVGLRFIHSRDGIFPRGGALPQPGELREHEPHPVAALGTLAEFVEGPLIGSARVLGQDKPFQVVRIIHCVTPRSVL